jgi:hypothetical protein
MFCSWGFGGKCSGGKSGTPLLGKVSETDYAGHANVTSHGMKLLFAQQTMLRFEQVDKNYFSRLAKLWQRDFFLSGVK